MGPEWQVGERAHMNRKGQGANLEIQKIWEFWELRTWKSRNLASKQSKNSKFSKSNSILPQILARSGLEVNKNSLSNFVPFQRIFTLAENMQNKYHMLPNFLGGPMGIKLTRFGPFHKLTTRIQAHQAGLHPAQTPAAIYVWFMARCVGQSKFLFPHLGWIAARAHQGK